MTNFGHQLDIYIISTMILIIILFFLISCKKRIFHYLEFAKYKLYNREEKNKTIYKQLSIIEKRRKNKTIYKHL